MLNGSVASPDKAEASAKISVVVPVYNSERALPEIYCRIKMALDDAGSPFEMILVEDCSTDDSWRVLCALASFDERVTVLQLMRNSGKAAATLAGMSWARGDLIVTFDDDLRHMPEDIPELIHSLLRDEELDVVIGVAKRGAARPGERGGAVSRMGRLAAGWLRRRPLRLGPSIRHAGFRVMRRQLAEALLSASPSSASLNPMIASITGRIGHALVRRGNVAPGNLGLRGVFAQAASGVVAGARILFGRPVRLLRLFSVAGGVGVLASILTAAWFAALYFMGSVGSVAVPEVDGLVLLAVGLSGFNFLALSLIAEYLDRIARIWSNTSRWIVRRAMRHQLPKEHNSRGSADDPVSFLPEEALAAELEVGPGIDPDTGHVNTLSAGAE